jgi:hypothetical protein
MGVGGQLHAPAALPPGNRLGTHYIGGWLTFRTSNRNLLERRAGAYRSSRKKIPYVFLLLLLLLFNIFGDKCNLI